MLFKYKKLFIKEDLDNNKDKLDMRIIEQINDNKIYVPSIKNLNDPFEKMFNFTSYESYTAKEKENLLKLDENKVPEFENFGKNLLDSFDSLDSSINTFSKFMVDETEMGIFSMSERNDSILMWSHYADSHKGICIGYDKESFLKNNSCIKVQYKKHLPEFSLKKTYKNYIPRIYRYKFWAWNYEKEWRYLDTSFDECVDNPSFAKAIYFGLYVPEKVIEDFKRLIKINVSFYKTELDKNDFKLNFIQLK